MQVWNPYSDTNLHCVLSGQSHSILQGEHIANQACKNITRKVMDMKIYECLDFSIGQMDYKLLFEKIQYLIGTIRKVQVLLLVKIYV